MTISNFIQVIKEDLRHEFPGIEFDFIDRTDRVELRFHERPLEKNEFYIPRFAAAADIAKNIFTWAWALLDAEKVPRGQECHNHSWVRRRDGRQCSLCDKIEFGMTAEHEINLSDRHARQNPEVIMDQQQTRIRELEDMLHKFYERCIPADLREETEKLLGIVQTSNLG